MKRFIVTILSITLLVGSVFAKPKKVGNFSTDGMYFTGWECQGLENIFVTSDTDVAIFLAKCVMDGAKIVCNLNCIGKIEDWKNKDAKTLIIDNGWAFTRHNSDTFVYYLEEDKVYCIVLGD